MRCLKQSQITMDEMFPIATSPLGKYGLVWECPRDSRSVLLYALLFTYPQGQMTLPRGMVVREVLKLFLGNASTSSKVMIQDDCGQRLFGGRQTLQSNSLCWIRMP